MTSFFVLMGLLFLLAMALGRLSSHLWDLLEARGTKLLKKKPWVISPSHPCNIAPFSCVSWFGIKLALFMRITAGGWATFRRSIIVDFALPPVSCYTTKSFHVFNMKRSLHAFLQGDLPCRLSKSSRSPVE